MYIEINKREYPLTWTNTIYNGIKKLEYVLCGNCRRNFLESAKLTNAKKT